MLLGASAFTISTAAYIAGVSALRGVLKFILLIWILLGGSAVMFVQMRWPFFLPLGIFKVIWTALTVFLVIVSMGNWKEDFNTIKKSIRMTMILFVILALLTFWLPRDTYYSFFYGRTIEEMEQILLDEKKTYDDIQQRSVPRPDGSRSV